MRRSSETTRQSSAPAAVSAENGEADLSFLILRAFYDLRGMLTRLLNELELTPHVQPGMGPVLYALYERGDVTISDIAERVLLAPSTLTNSLKRMESMGLVELSKCTIDRRAVRVSLTARARRLESKMQQLRLQVRQVLHGDLSEGEIPQTRRLLSKMIESMAVAEWESKHPRNNVRT